MMKLVCEVMVNGVATAKVLTTANNMNQGQLVKTLPGVGKPFYMFATLTGTLLAADFDGAPIVSSDIAENNAAIEAMLADPPLDKLTMA